MKSSYVFVLLILSSCCLFSAVKRKREDWEYSSTEPEDENDEQGQDGTEKQEQTQALALVQWVDPRFSHVNEHTLASPLPASPRRNEKRERRDFCTGAYPTDAVTHDDGTIVEATSSISSSSSALPQQMQRPPKEAPLVRRLLQHVKQQPSAIPKTSFQQQVPKAEAQAKQHAVRTRRELPKPSQKPQGEVQAAAPQAAAPKAAAAKAAAAPVQANMVADKPKANPVHVIAPWRMAKAPGPKPKAECECCATVEVIMGDLQHLWDVVVHNREEIAALRRHTGM